MGKPKKTSATVIEDRERRMKAIRLRKAGLTLDEIVDARIGYSSRGAVSNAIQRSLEDSESEEVETYRELNKIRLEDLLRLNWAIAHSQGDPEQMKAMENCRRIIADLRQLYGLDSPTRLDVKSTQSGPLKISLSQISDEDLLKAIEIEELELDD